MSSESWVKKEKNPIAFMWTSGKRIYQEDLWSIVLVLITAGLIAETQSFLEFEAGLLTEQENCTRCSVDNGPAKILKKWWL